MSIRPRASAQPVVLLLIAAALGVTAWITHRQLQVLGERIEAHQAVNRLVLARACTLVGALLAGGYLGYAVSWLGPSRVSTSPSSTTPR